MKAKQEVNGERGKRREAKGSEGVGEANKVCVRVGSVNAGVGSREESWIKFVGSYLSTALCSSYYTKA